MAFEIEHKYLVRNSAYRDMAVASINILQGYLCRDPERTVRVRIRNNEGYLTVKGINSGNTRNEYEYEIPVDDASEMLGLCEAPILEKTRYLVNFKGFIWEVDEFHGKQEGLVVAEIELPESDIKYELPSFIGENVTGDPAYYNSNL